MRYIKACAVSNFRTGFDSWMVCGINPFVFLYSLHPKKEWRKKVKISPLGGIALSSNGKELSV